MKLAPENAKIIDTSTAHRTDDKWVYGSEFLRATDIRHTLEDNAPVQKHLQGKGVRVLVALAACRGRRPLGPSSYSAPPGRSRTMTASSVACLSDAAPPAGAAASAH